MIATTTTIATMTTTTTTTIVEISFGLVDIQQSKTTAKTMGTAEEEEGVAAC